VIKTLPLLLGYNLGQVRGARGQNRSFRCMGRDFVSKITGRRNLYALTTKKGMYLEVIEVRLIS